MCDKDVADAQELARSKPGEVAKIEKQRAPFEHEIDVKSRIVEGIVDERGVKMERHGSSTSSRRH